MRPIPLVLIASPIHMHREQCILAMQHGAHVLCEKPLAPIVQDALAIRDAAAKYNKKLGVGFQMSFCDPIQNLKKDIRAGLLGAPRSLRSYVSWQRFDSYYNSPWKGRVRDAQGHWILDSILTNATAHYLHNTFFVLGSEQDSAAMPQSLRVELYNGKGIETFDTAFVQGEFAGGSDFFIAVTHSGDRNIDPVLRYEFELRLSPRPATTIPQRSSRRSATARPKTTARRSANTMWRRRYAPCLLLPTTRRFPCPARRTPSCRS